jgi:hypothetical protein
MWGLEKRYWTLIWHGVRFEVFTAMKIQVEVLRVVTTTLHGITTQKTLTWVGEIWVHFLFASKWSYIPSI